MRDLARKVIDLQTPDKLTVAAALLVAGKVDLAEAVATRAVQEIQLAMLFGRKR